MDFKIMVTGKNESIIWDIATETALEPDHKVYQFLSEEIDYLRWNDVYWELYQKWLSNGDSLIYNIHNSINMEMINALVGLNKKNGSIKLYYWFDVDRDKYPDHLWQRCPLSNSLLVDLTDSFHVNNRKISTEWPLIFP